MEAQRRFAVVRSPVENGQAVLCGDGLASGYGDPDAQVTATIIPMSRTLGERCAARLRFALRRPGDLPGEGAGLVTHGGRCARTGPAPVEPGRRPRRCSPPGDVLRGGTRAFETGAIGPCLPEPGLAPPAGTSRTSGSPDKYRILAARYTTARAVPAMPAPMTATPTESLRKPRG